MSGTDPEVLYAPHRASDYEDLRPDRVRSVEVQPDTDGDWIPGDLEAIE